MELSFDLRVRWTLLVLLSAVSRKVVFVGVRWDRKRHIAGPGKRSHMQPVRSKALFIEERLYERTRLVTSLDRLLLLLLLVHWWGAPGCDDVKERS